MDKKTRIERWREYREQFDSIESIHFSIVNSDEKIKSLLKSINFNIEDAYKKASYGPTTHKYKVDKKSNTNKKKEIEDILKKIEKNENITVNSKIDNDFNSHEYDAVINENFLEFLKKDELIDQQNQETTDLKINKINIVDSKEK